MNEYSLEYSLIAVAQINVALGILYINLKELRFREAIYENIFQLLEACRFGDLYKHESGEKARLKLFDSVPEFSKHYHRIRAWILELPAAYQEQMPDVILALRQELPTSKEVRENSLLKRHRMFRKNKDKLWVWRGTILPSLAVLWMCVFSSDYGVFLLAVLLVGWGQIVLIYFYAVGRRVARGTVDDLGKSLKIVMDLYGKYIAHQQFGESDGECPIDS